MTTGVEIARSPRVFANDIDLSFGEGPHACLQWDTAETNDALKLGLRLNNAAYSGNVVLASKTYIDSDTGLPIAADPRLVVWCGDDPAAGGAAKYLSLRHNRSDAVIDTGAGDLRLQPSSKVIIGGASAPSADSLLHLWSASAGSIAAASDARLTIENSVSAAIQFLGSDTGLHAINFGAPTQTNIAGRITYQHAAASSGNLMSFIVAQSTILTLATGAGSIITAYQSLQFSGAKSITTTSGDLTLTAGASLVLAPSTSVRIDTKINYHSTYPTQTTVGAAGGASALPATPTGYLRVQVNGSEMAVPYYAQA